MSRLLIVPEFCDDITTNVNELIDFFLIDQESAVALEQFTLLSDGQEGRFSSGPGEYKTALLLLYLAVLARKTTYVIDCSWRRKVVLYYGDRLINEVQHSPRNHPALALLLGDTVTVDLELKHGYMLPDCKGRTIQELIVFAWERRDELTAETPVPMIRLALISFQRALQRHSIPIMQNKDNWPSLCWVERVNELLRRLAIPLPTPRLG